MFMADDGNLVMYNCDGDVVWELGVHFESLGKPLSLTVNGTPPVGETTRDKIPGFLSIMRVNDREDMDTWDVLYEFDEAKYGARVAAETAGRLPQGLERCQAELLCFLLPSPSERHTP
jgi:hypothetical protein